MTKTLVPDRTIPKPKWEAARALANQFGSWRKAYDALPDDADPEIRRILDFARHGGTTK